MTPAERDRARALAVAANHPSTKSAAHLRREPAGDGGSAAAESSSTPFDDFHATVTDINDAADRLRRLRAGRP